MTAPAGEPGPASFAAQGLGGAGVADAAGGLGFPDVPRLELEQLLVQLRDRADDVLATQGRLRGLLRAYALVAGELSVPLVLRQIVGAAQDLLGARYAALGILGRDGGLEQFVHAGMDGELVTRIGDLPAGRGILGLLISEPVPIRLADLSAHPASAATACVIVVLMTFLNAVTGSSSASLSDTWASSSVVVGHAAPIGSAWPPLAWHRGPCPCGHYALPGDAALNHAAHYRHVAAP